MRIRGDPAAALTERQFSAVQSRVARTWDAYLQTAHGRSREVAALREPPLTYHEFIQHPPITPSQLPQGQLDSLLLAQGELKEFLTTGTRGEQRSIHWPAGTGEVLASLLVRARPAERITLAHTKADVATDVFLYAHVESFRHVVPHGGIRSFATPTDVAEIASVSDAVLLISYPSALARFLRLTLAAMSEGELDPADVRGTKLIVRLTGEPMSASELSVWYRKGLAIGYDLVIELHYGATEFFGIAKGKFDPSSQTIAYRLQNKGCFAEVLDQRTLSPLYEGEGVLCATSFRTSGTILYRYLLGDTVETYPRNGERYVRNVHRPDALIVVGNTVSLSDLVAGVRARTGLEICLEVRKQVDRTTGVQHLDVTTHVPSNEPTALDRARYVVYERLLDHLKIRSKVSSGFVELTVTAETLEAEGRRQKKAWKLNVA